MPETRIHDGELVPPVESLERYFRSGGTTILQAAFEHSYFVHPDRVRQNIRQPQSNFGQRREAVAQGCKAVAEPRLQPPPVVAVVIGGKLGEGVV